MGQRYYDTVMVYTFLLQNHYLNAMDWKEENNRLTKTFKFDTFATAMAWMVKASFAIEKLNHHPEWTNVYNRVSVSLCTHDAGNTVTDKDRELAKVLDAV
jgi:4a-hydroxytetrahydrobiopterin dehydratase